MRGYVACGGAVYHSSDFYQRACPGSGLAQDDVGSPGDEECARSFVCGQEYDV